MISDISIENVHIGHSMGTCKKYPYELPLTAVNREADTANPESPDGNYLVSIQKLRMSNYRFPNRKGGIFCSGKELKGLRGGVQHVRRTRKTVD
jgi:hypothetical protein